MKQLDENLLIQSDAWMSQFDRWQQALFRKTIENGQQLGPVARADIPIVYMRILLQAHNRGVDVTPYLDAYKKPFPQSDVTRLELLLSTLTDASPNVRQIMSDLYNSRVGRDEFRALSRILINKDYDVRKLTRFNSDQLDLLGSYWVTSDLIDVVLSRCTPEIHHNVMEQIMRAELDGVDIQPYVKAGYTPKQLAQIRYGLRDNIDVSTYARKELSWKEMKSIRIELTNAHLKTLPSEELPNVPGWVKPLSSEQLYHFRKDLADGADMSPWHTLDARFLRYR